MMKKNTKKSSIKTFIYVLLAIIILLLLVFFAYRIYNNNGVAKYINKEYKLYDDVDEKTYTLGSCLTFNKDKTFSEYDCGENSSNMPFSGEYCYKYTYDKLSSKIIFYCKCPDGVPNCKSKFVVDVIKWDSKELILEYTDRNLNTRAVYR